MEKENENENERERERENEHCEKISKTFVSSYEIGYCPR
jgi:hypothetical protein